MIWIVLAIGILVVIIGLVMLIMVTREIHRTNDRYPEGHYISIGIALGIPLGLPIGLAVGNIALGPAFGLPIGVAIGAALESKARKDGRLRPPTARERKVKKTFVVAGGALLVLAIISLFVLLILS